MSSRFSRGYALVIGVANYPHIRKLSETVLKDGRDMVALLCSENYCGYMPTNVKLLLDQQATVAGVRQGLRWLTEVTGSEDTAVVYFSGHGGRVENGANAGTYLIPFDCEGGRLQETALSSTELTTLFSDIKAQRLVIMLDACHSAGAGELKVFAEFPEIKAGLDEKTYNSLAQGKGRVIMASSRSNEVSLVLPGMKNSLFTFHLLEALKGGSPTHGDGMVRVFDVFHYVSDKVPAQAAQHPIFKAHDVENNFPLALYLGGKQKTPLAPVTPLAARPMELDGKTKIEITKRLVMRWSDLATYFEIPLPDLATFERGHEPRKILDWLEQRRRLGELRDAFNFLRWDDLIVELDRHPS